MMQEYPEPGQFYAQSEEDYQHKVSSARKSDLRWSLFRFLVVLSGGFHFYQYLAEDHTYWLWLAIAHIGLFILMLRWHHQLRSRLAFYRKMVRINQEEQAYLQGDFQSFGTGARFMDPQHSYSHDLDIFGHRSLFQRINRCISQRGEEFLAAALLQNFPAEEILQRQQAIAELSAKTPWRQKFRAEGGELSDESSLRKALRHWMQMKRPAAFSLHGVVLLLPALLSIGLLINWIWQPDLQRFNWFSYAFIFNLIYLFLHFRWIMKEYHALTGISATLGMYAALIRLMETESFQAPLLKDLQGKLGSGEGRASREIAQLSQLLSSFDQLNNVMALLLTNGLYLNHLHLLRRLYQWKERNAAEVLLWLDTAAEMDALSSLANYRFNHPSFVLPEISSEARYDATNMGHPFIEEAKRVGNRVGLRKGEFIILTGSNMSGKSTYLKALGLNLVLARSGAAVCADSMQFFPFRLLTSMKQVDDINESRSYFQAEVLRLKEIMQVLLSGSPCFLLLDEILRGTNSEDKKQGSRRFMEGLTTYNAMGILATHDVDIADLATQKQNCFRAEYFESAFVDGDLSFDYRLREGVCTTPNAVKLMEKEGII